MKTQYHKPVLLTESIEGLNINPDGIYVDLTFGGGGHSLGILNCLNSKGRLIAFDQDKDAQNNALLDERFTLIHQNFKHLKNVLRYLGHTRVDGVLGDLGVSSHQFNTPERGFSTRFEGPLDMRMNTQSEQTARHIVNSYSQEDLADVFFQYGELRNARKIASKLVEARQKTPITNIEALKRVVAPLKPSNKQAQFLAQLFQALRIVVNGELEALRALLQQIPSVLKVGGRLVVISYHSLEDKLVKNFIRNGQLIGKAEADFYGHVNVPLKAINRKAIMPSEAKIMENSRARSARLRIAERLEN